VNTQAIEALEKLKDQISSAKEGGAPPLEIAPDDIAGVLVSIFMKAPQQLDFLSSEMSRMDKAVSAIYHQIETIKFNAVEGYVLAKKLKDTLRERRVIKYHHEILQMLSPLVEANRPQVLAIGKKVFQRQSDFREYRVDRPFPYSEPMEDNIG
jgi:hypothetical protein